VEPGQAVVDDSGESTGKVQVVGDRGAVLSGVEDNQPFGVLDDIDVDRPWRSMRVRSAATSTVAWCCHRHVRDGSRPP
jgi:hypothetical protein